ncbi:MAG: hypothetical protein HW380_3817 [Magnetococcales bacterium]|nr:hypothetical protein [Magnetococcales bacterium]HIJ85892.1 modified peptide precursor CbpA [Magnetococcales bacterium]
MSKQNQPTTGVTQPLRTVTPARIVEEVIAQRKSCSADGVGLSHYILMDRKDK